MAVRVWRLGELAKLVEAELRGDPEREIGGVRSLEQAGATDLACVRETRHLARARESRAGALLVGREMAADEALAADLLIVERPQYALVRLLEELHPEPAPEPGVHPTAVVAEDAVIDSSASIGPYAVVGSGTRVEGEAAIHAHVVVGRQCVVGAGAVLHPHVVVYDRTEIGMRTVAHAGCVLGADGFGYASDSSGHTKVPQIGRLVVEADVEVGANSTIDRGALEETRIGRGTKIDNLVQIGHNAIVGAGCILCGQAGLAGSARLGDGVVMGGQSGTAGHFPIGDRVQVAAKSAVFQSVDAGEVVGGIPARPIRRWQREMAALSRVRELQRRLAQLERKLEASEREEEQ